MDARIHLFGIRHHGPGCARSLQQALEALDPEAVLVEGPPEAEAVIDFARAPEMRPPLALLVYAESDPTLASFFPFAEFSPEWRALLWALTHRRPLRFIDLPSTFRLAAEEAAAKQAAEAENAEADNPGPETSSHQRLRGDPLAHLAAAAGYDDSEAWWNNLIEQGAPAPELFAAIESAMTALREDAVDETEEAGDEGLWEDRREAHMRLEIGKALQDFSGPIAVVVGAWHVPALRRKTKASEDRALLKGLAKIKVTVTWVPWTDSRLAVASGYGAGVRSPGWYRHIWAELQRLGPEECPDLQGGAARWQTRVAELLRRQGQVIAPASVIEAARLSTSLAALRELAVPGLSEMQDASLAAICFGQAAPMKLIERQLVVGAEVGEIAEDVPQIPLQADLQRWQKRLRLKPEALEQEVALDLRSEAGLLKSSLLHRLKLIAVPWGELLDAGRSRGTFRERWLLQWEPEFSVRLVEAMVWGTTIAQAAGNAARGRAEETGALSDLAGLVHDCLVADLPEAARDCIEALQISAVETGEVAPLLEAVPPLADILRYGTARRIPERELRLLVTSLTEEIFVGLAYACRQLEEEAAAEMLRRCGVFDRAIQLLESDRLRNDWQRALLRLAEDHDAAPLLKGFATRRLYDHGSLDSAATSDHLSRALSPALGPQDGAAWLEGFLADAGQLLLHDQALFAVIDDWLLALPEQDFTNLLPLLRRTFGGFDAMEQRHLLTLVRKGPRPERRLDPSVRTAAPQVDEAFACALPLLQTILGLRR